MKLALAFSLAVMALGASAGGVAAAPLGFEGIPFTNFPSNLNGYGLSNTAFFNPPGYGNLAWSSNFNVVEAANFTTRTGANPANGISNGLVSGSYVAINGGAAPVSFEAIGATELFNLGAANMAAAWYDGLEVVVTGYRDGVAVYSKTTGPLHYTSQLIEFGWYDIDKVTFESVDGTGQVIDNQSTYNHAFVLDDLAVAVPEPASASLLLAGLALTGIAARRRKIRQA